MDRRAVLAAQDDVSYVLRRSDRFSTWALSTSAARSRRGAAQKNARRCCSSGHLPKLYERDRQQALPQQPESGFESRLRARRRDKGHPGKCTLLPNEEKVFVDRTAWQNTEERAPGFRTHQTNGCEKLDGKIWSKSGFKAAVDPRQQKARLSTGTARLIPSKRGESSLCLWQQMFAHAVLDNPGVNTSN